MTKTMDFRRMQGRIAERRKAARAMLAVLWRISRSDPNNTQFAVLVIAEAREAIAQAEAAGITVEG